MKKLLKFLELKILALLVISLSCFMACNINQDFEEAKFGNVAFSPNVDNVENYRWEYCYTKDFDEKEWIWFFDDSSLGLGEVTKLEMNTNYYFGLRGYDPLSGELVWEGYHCRFDGENKTPVPVSIQRTSALITVGGEPSAGFLT